MLEAKVGRFRGGFCVYWWESGRRRRYQLGARTRKEAEAEALDVIRRETAKAGGLKIGELWDMYAAEKAGKPMTKTIGYFHELRSYFEEFRPDQVTVDHCRGYVRKRRGQGRGDGAIWSEMIALRTVLNWAKKRTLISAAPYIEIPPKPAPKERWLTMEEVRALVDAAEAPHIRLAIILLFSTAGRVGAVLDLTWRRVDFQQGIINLRSDSEGPRKGRAIVPMNSTARAALAVAKHAALSNYVIEYGGGPVKSIRKGFYSACQRAGLKDVTIHTIRHSAAVHMAASGVPLSKISQYLGHSNTGITEKVYSRFAPSHMADAAEVLELGTPRKVQ